MVTRSQVIEGIAHQMYAIFGGKIYNDWEYLNRHEKIIWIAKVEAIFASNVNLAVVERKQPSSDFGEGDNFQSYESIVNLMIKDGWVKEIKK